MRRTAALSTIVAAVLAVFAAGANADTFAVVSDQAPAATAALPGAGVPNQPGSVVIPSDLTTPPSTHIELSMADLQSLWQRAGAAYGISWQVLGAINKIESNFGQNMGPSSAGAVGWMQFMPSTWERWGVDANGDGVADPWNPDDAVYAAARYLAAAGGSTDIRSAIFSYNHATWYVDDVLQMAGLIGSGDSTTTPALDQLGQRVARLRARVERLRHRLDAARARVDSLAVTESRLIQRADSRQLLSDKLDIRMHAAHVELRRSAAGAAVERLRTLLDQAETDLTTPQPLPASSFASGLGTAVAAPGASGLVYPLGQPGRLIGFPYQGTHLLYGNWESDNAVDISAPVGTPVYAVAAGTIGSQIGALDSADPHLQGERLHLVTADDEYYYAHLSVIVVQAGQTVQAGQLLGYSGEANGVAHLHLAERNATGAEQAGTTGGTHWYDYIAAAAASASPLVASTGTQPVAFDAPPPRIFAVVPTS